MKPGFALSRSLAPSMRPSARRILHTEGRPIGSQSMGISYPVATSCNPDQALCYFTVASQSWERGNTTASLSPRLQSDCSNFLASTLRDYFHLNGTDLGSIPQNYGASANYMYHGQNSLYIHIHIQPNKAYNRILYSPYMIALQEF